MKYHLKKHCLAVLGLCIFNSVLNMAWASGDGEELASYMGMLQRLTHKLSLSAAAGNTELVGFYLHESEELLEDIQKEVPEYEAMPIALLVERISLPAYQGLETLLAKKDTEITAKALKKASESVIDSCNQCHQATKHGFIKITTSTNNPFNQDFKP